MSNAWTVEQEGLLTEYWDKGLSASQIGGLLGMTRNSIIGKKNRMGLPGRPKPKREPALTKRKRMIAQAMVVRTTKTIQQPTFVKNQAPPRTSKPIPIALNTWDHGLPSSCRAIVQDAPTLYCGLDVAYGRSYCSEHCQQFLNGFQPK